MNAAFAPLLLCGFLTCGQNGNVYQAGYLCEPAYVMDDAVRGPLRKYVPQPGDIYLSTDRSWIINAGHRLAFSGQPNHSGIVIALPDGKPAILEGGPFNGLKVEIVDLHYDLSHHEERTEKCWIRARKNPLTKEQSDVLTKWAQAQHGKPFAAGRMLLQLTPFRNRGPLRTYLMGAPNGERDAYFCSELVLETCVHLGLLSAETTRPSATYPEDLFYDKSKNLYLNSNFTLAEGWHPPARWVGSPAVESKKSSDR
jgi:hypothetical protein